MLYFYILKNHGVSRGFLLPVSLFNFLDEKFECFWVFYCYLRQYLPVQFNIFCLLNIDKLTVFESKQSKSIVESSDPKCSESSFFSASVSVSILSSFDYSLLCCSEVALSVPAETLCKG